MIKIVHFADAHIDIAIHGKHDPDTGLPVRVLDFLHALDTIVDTAINEQADLVIFAGDAYKDRTPSPTFQREWGKRIIRLSQAGIPTLLLVGNHDLSPASGRAHTLQEYDTLQVPKVRVLAKPELLKPDDLWGLPLQVIALPWVYRSTLMATLGLSLAEEDTVNEEIEARLTRFLDARLQELDPALPAVLVAHGSVQGALYGNERTVMLGKDIILPGGLVRDPRLDYVALGHIHKHQDVNAGQQPPVVYPGSIERVDFGEAADDKGFVLVNLEKGNASYKFRKVNGRPFIDRRVTLKEKEGLMEKLFSSLPSQQTLEGAIVRLVVEYPRELGVFIDENMLRERCANTMEFHFIRHPQEESRLRLPADQTIASLTPLQLLDTYWKSKNTEVGNTEELQALATSVIQAVEGFDEETLDQRTGDS
jgi:DNA repair protein SbcD/Mre11